MSIVSDSIQAVLHVQRQHGWRKAFGQSAQFILTPFFEFHRGYLLRKSLKDPIYVPAAEVDLHIRQAIQDDQDLLETIMPPLRVKRITQKMQAGEICCIAIKEEMVIAYVLAGFAGTPSTKDTGLNLSPNEAYLWAGYALPQYRRQGVVRAVNLNLCRLLQEKGSECVLLIVDRHNKASLGHCRKMGYRMTDRITSLRILNRGMSWCVPIKEDTESVVLR